ncbi:hypothetical protein, partial [Mesorhizobium sp. M1D.F.Ca.ET.183.01.1.1]|uniref:hypothetical protein n=1 Tax=Mesorhizobium sp. M1D.F.Ca.ET.183.01.1.1 TaxID=2496666 RepID=UPI001AEF28C8
MSAIMAWRTAAIGGSVETCTAYRASHRLQRYNSLYGDFSVKFLVWLSAIFSLSFSTAGAWAKSGAVDRESEAGVNPDREQLSNS